MEKEFIPYEQALALKELGFNEPCFGYYRNNEKVTLTAIDYDNLHSNNDLPPQYYSAPTFSQAFRWFREKYKLVNYIEYYAEWNFEIFRIDDKIAEVQDDVNVDYTFKGGTYEEAELECLRKLIEIVNEKN
jgi:hypothetical protein